MAPALRVQNPYEEQHTVLLSRIIGNVEKLNEAMLELTKSLGEINAHNDQTAFVAEMWSNYMRNAKWNLEAQGTLKPPQ